ncbi:DNA recombination protein RmuC [Enterovirga sp.]|uniref:DNA recombination protein RmuC n=1 Tax=Enterovirga sp. TaxID=2026350 RepID=UPI00261B18DE|nr:DNA recombination protein RmuC [Enterovirga sp.]MDB5592388.1 hypothetical protein [Enterovirga sp.]
MDPNLYALAFSGLAALLAAVAAYGALRPRTVPGLDRLADGLDDLRADLDRLRAALADEMRHGREEAGTGARHLREELQATLHRIGQGAAEKVEAVAVTVGALGEANERRLAELRRESEESGKALRDEVSTQVKSFGDLLGQRLESAATQQKERLEEVGSHLRRLTQSSAEHHEALRAKLEEKLEALRQDNAGKLEEMRRTVDEKLQGTLEERLGEKFKLVSHHLEQVHRSVGEMQSLASGVDGLRRVLTNVKTRGTWAEVSLGSLLEQVLTAEQFDRNVEVVPGSGERVEFAIRMPNGPDGGALWLAIDAKFPVEDYERLLDAVERADAAAVEVSSRALETRIKQEGAKICAKYVSPPHTVDFGVLFLPTEGLYAEVLRRPGLVQHLQTECRIIVAGPTNLHAFLTSLRMGFRTLAIEQRSSEVWQTLAAVKTEFGKYGDVLDAVKKKLQQASRQIEDVSKRSRAVGRKLRDVESLPEAEASSRLALDSLIADEADLLDAAE